MPNDRRCRRRSLVQQDSFAVWARRRVLVEAPLAGGPLDDLVGCPGEVAGDTRPLRRRGPNPVCCCRGVLSWLDLGLAAPDAAVHWASLGNAPPSGRSSRSSRRPGAGKGPRREPAPAPAHLRSALRDKIATEARARWRRPLGAGGAVSATSEGAQARRHLHYEIVTDAPGHRKDRGVPRPGQRVDRTNLGGARDLAGRARLGFTRRCLVGHLRVDRRPRRVGDPGARSAR